MEKYPGCKPGAVMLREFESRPAQSMSTSNVKTPIIPRLGFLSDWGNKNTDELQKEFLKCELERYGLLLINYNDQIDIAQVVYYKWLQTPFVPYKQRRIKKNRRMNVKINQKFTNINKQVSTINNYKASNILKRKYSFFDRIKYLYSLSQEYRIPSSVQLNIKNAIGMNEFQILNWLNVYQSVKEQELKSINVINFSFYAQQLNSWKNFKYFLDAIAICNFIQLNIATTNALFNVIKLAFIRNSKKGQQRSFLIYIQKLMTILPVYTQKEQNNFGYKKFYRADFG